MGFINFGKQEPEMNKIVKPYTLLTGLYDNLMEYVDYEGWAEYLKDIIYDYELNVDSALELAAGNCRVYNYLKDWFKFIVVSDLSLPLIAEFTSENDKVVCCDMRAVPLKKKFDFIYCTFDSINYLLTEEDLLKTFKEVNSLLGDEGIFTFDASLEANSINNVNELNRGGKYKNYEYRQISRYDSKKKFHTNEFVITDGKDEYTEKHVQKVFDFTDYFRLLDDAGLQVLDCFDTFTFDYASPESERAQFIVGKY